VALMAIEATASTSRARPSIRAAPRPWPQNSEPGPTPSTARSTTTGGGHGGHADREV